MNKFDLIFGDFMQDIEEWAAETDGSPTKENMADLDNIYKESAQEIKKIFIELIGPDQNITDVHSPEFIVSKWQDDLRHQLRRKVEEL